MFLLEQQPTAYDLQFRIAGIPVRVHPLFWLMSVIFGARSNDGRLLLIWVGVVFVSILAHELGHAFAHRYFGQGARIVLYLFGGLTSSEADAWGATGRRRRTPRDRVLISAAGPGAGFLLAAVVVAAVFATGGSVQFRLQSGFLPDWRVHLLTSAAENPYLYVAIYDLLWVNIFWGLINLLPVLPLDGGRIAQELLVQQDPYRGSVQALWLSVFTGAIVALLGGVVLKDMYLALFFGSLAASSYQVLQQGGGRPW